MPKKTTTPKTTPPPDETPASLGSAVAVVPVLTPRACCWCDRPLPTTTSRGVCATCLIRDGDRPAIIDTYMAQIECDGTRRAKAIADTTSRWPAWEVWTAPTTAGGTAWTLDTCWFVDAQGVWSHRYGETRATFHSSRIAPTGYYDRLDAPRIACPSCGMEHPDASWLCTCGVCIGCCDCWDTPDDGAR